MAPVQPKINHALQQLHTKRGKPLFRLVRILRVLCQIFGVVPVPGVRPAAGGRAWPRRLHCAWCVTLLLYMYSVSYWCTTLISSGIITIEKAFYLSEFLSNCLIVTYISGGCYYYADYFRSVPRKLMQLYKNLKRFQPEYRAGDCLYRQLYRELCVVSCIIGAFLMSCFAVDFIYFEYDVLRSLRSSGAYNLPNLLISLNLGQYWLSLRFIGLLYKRLNEVLQQRLGAVGGAKEAGVSSIEHEPHSLFALPLAWCDRREFNHPPATKATQAKHETLKYIRALYSDLDTLTVQVVNAFGIVLLLNFLGSFLDLAVEYFAIYRFFDRSHLLKQEYVLFVYKWQWLALHTGRIFFVLITNNAVINEKCRTSFILNEFEITSKEMEHAINRFLMQLMVRKQCEMACGIFDLDLLFLGGIASTLANYVIFLIQIDLGNESLTVGILNKTR